MRFALPEMWNLTKRGSPPFRSVSLVGFVRSTWMRRTAVGSARDSHFSRFTAGLVATEQEYLLARQNQQQLNSSTVRGVSSGAASLANAAKERLAQWEVPQEEIAKLESTGKVITDLTFNAPASGYVTEKNVLPNMYVLLGDVTRRRR